jgi:hypothetical protein
MYQADSWEEMKDDAGNTLNIGRLEYKTKHGKKPGSFLDEVFPRDVKSALFLLVNLFLEQAKVKDEDSNIHDSLMKLSRLQLLMKDCMQIPLERLVIGFTK